MPLSSIPTPPVTPALVNALKPRSAGASRSLCINQATVLDASAIAALGTKTFTESFGHSMDKDDLADFLAAKYSAAFITSELPDPTKTTLVARDADTRIVGMVQLLRGKTDPSVEGTEAELAVLQRLFVDSTVHGQGIGSKLVAAVEEMARQEGYKQLWLTVWEDSERAQNLYRKLGYRKTGETGFAVGATVQRDLVFAKYL